MQRTTAEMGKESTCSPAHLGLCSSTGKGWFCYLAGFVSVKTISYWTNCTTSAVFIYFWSFYQPQLLHLPVPWPGYKWVESDRMLHTLNVGEKKTKNKHNSEKKKGLFKKTFVSIQPFSVSYRWTKRNVDICTCFCQTKKTKQQKKTV